MKRSALSVAVLYALFAAAASALNLGVQWIAARLWPLGLRDLAALAAGTAAGLVLKYVLDKRWIFHFRPPSLSDDARRFVLYVCTGAATTALFWGVELLVIAAMGTPWARFAGGAAGLCAGYSLKYILDRTFVFPAYPAPGPEPGREPSSETPSAAVTVGASRRTRKGTAS